MSNDNERVSWPIEVNCNWGKFWSFLKRGEEHQITCDCDPVGFQLKILRCNGITRLRLVLWQEAVPLLAMWNKMKSQSREREGETTSGKFCWKVVIFPCSTITSSWKLVLKLFNFLSTLYIRKYHGAGAHLLCY